jgi:hypothetical protein
MPFEHPSSFPIAAKIALEDTQLRRNLGHATRTIREKRELAVAELPDWQDLREAGRQIKDRVMRHLPKFLEQLETSITSAGGVVHWARDAEEANRIISGIVQSHKATEVIKVKSITTDEIGLNDALARDGIQAIETDLAELIVQLAHDHPSHILVPAIHKNRAEIRALFLKALKLEPNDLTDDPKALADAARTYLRRKFLETKVAISGANFAIAETGTVGVVESEGNGRMCLTLPDVLISVMGIEKVLPELRDLEVMLQLLPRSSTAERMNPYTSLWTGVHVGDGPQEFHFVLLDNGRTKVLEDEVGRQALHSLLSLPERLPGLRTHGRSRLRQRLPRPDWGNPDPAIDRPRNRARAIAAVRLEFVRGVLRGLSGQDQHSRDSDSFARRGGQTQEDKLESDQEFLEHRSNRHEDGGVDVRGSHPLRTRTESRQSWTTSTGKKQGHLELAGTAGRLDEHPRFTRRARAEFSSMVART